MERLIFKNATGQSITFSSARDATYRWLQVRGLGEVETEQQITTSPYQDGASPVGIAYYGIRTVQLDMAIVSDDLAAAIRELNRVLNPKLGLGTLIYERDGVSKALNRLKTRVMPTFEGGSSRGLTFQLSSVIFEAYDPLFTDAEYSEAEVVSGDNLFSFPLNVTDVYEFDYTNSAGILVDNAGDVDCPVELIFDGPCSSPIEVENLMTGEKIVLALDLTSDQRLTITTGVEDTNVMLTELSTGAQTVAFQYIDVTETTFFQLVAGLNIIKVTANEAEVETATLRYKQRYAGL